MAGKVYQPDEVLKNTDIAFLAFHGSYGEDGTVQRLLEKYNTPYTGSGPDASALAMNKLSTKEKVGKLDIKLAPHQEVKSGELSDIDNIISGIGKAFGPEYVVKPLCSGSSVGVVMADDLATLKTALKTALKNYPSVLVEKRIKGREATAGVIERFKGQEIYSLPVIEIIPPETSDYFDRTNKYDGSTEEICPGRFSEAETTTLQQAAADVHQTLGLRQYSRSDFIVADDGVYFLEVNTLPGLTPTSLLPLSIKTIGSSYSELITHLLTDAIN